MVPASIQCSRCNCECVGGKITVKDSDDNTLWQADEHNIYGHLTQFHTGNGLTTYRDYDSENGRLLGIITSDGRNLLQNYAYTYDDFCIFAPFGRIVRNTMNKKSLWKYHYTITDHLGNTRVEFVSHNGSLPEVVQSVSYYPFGYTLRCNDYGSRQPNRHLFGGKELQDQTLAGITFGWYDFETRMYDPLVGRMLSPDIVIQDEQNSQAYNRYSYCFNNPLKYTDPSGYISVGGFRNRTSTLLYFDYWGTNSNTRSSFSTDESLGNQIPVDDWYEDSDGNINWTDYKSQAEMDKAGLDGKYLGEIVVLFKGSTNENLGENDYLNGEGANPAIVTVYGKYGTDDIESYTGYTMSSNYTKYGAIDDGYYDVVYDKEGKSGLISSHYAVNNRYPVDCLYDMNNGWYNGVPNSYSPTQKNGIFVHRTNKNGFAGENVSTGCPLILGSQWNRFEKQIGQNGFKMIIIREHNKEHKCILK